MKTEYSRQTIDLNHDWLFFDVDLTAKSVFSASAAKARKVTLPHTVRVVPLNNFDPKVYELVRWYRTQFRLPASAKGKQIFIEFDGVMLAAKIFLNGKIIGEHKGGFTPFRFDLTKHAKFNAQNTLAVQVDCRERPDIPPFGNIVDYLTFGGIYREVRLIITDPLHINDIFPFAINVLKETPALLVQFDLQNAGPAREVQLKAELIDDTGKTVARTNRPISLGAKKSISENICLQDLGKIRLWDLDDPYLYKVRMTLEQNGQSFDQVEKTFGFREAHFAKDGKFYLNGRPVKLMGLDRHQNYPYLGPAVGWRMQYRDAEILKYDLGLNIVRTSHYPQSPHFLDRCDQIGLLVLEEISGWQHIGDDKWKGVSLNELKEMIVRDRHHPAIILWGVRINESNDDHDFYTQTNQLAHQLDPTRQTGGIRYIRESEFLEDVFTFNDFSGHVQEPNHLPYLITEFAGHTFPTKSFDNPQRQIDHALLHARIQNQQMGNPQIAGAIGWCAFDYNTHMQFGSGDRICYHGVCDIFRQPKFAAGFYKSQIDPRRRVVLELADLWAPGDRFDPKGYLLIFSNCDQIDVFVGDKAPVTIQPDRQRYPNLPHPPFFLNILYEPVDLLLVGKIKGKVVIKTKFSVDKIPVKLAVAADHPSLVADGRDLTQLNFKLVDKYGHNCPYATGVVTAVAGGVELIGDNPFALVAGQGALYVRAGTKKGTAKITLCCSSGHRAEHTIKLL